MTRIKKVQRMILHPHNNIVDQRTQISFLIFLCTQWRRVISDVSAVAVDTMLTEADKGKIPNNKETLKLHTSSYNHHRLHFLQRVSTFRISCGWKQHLKLSPEASRKGTPSLWIWISCKPGSNQHLSVRNLLKYSAFLIQQPYSTKTEVLHSSHFRTEWINQGTIMTTINYLPLSSRTAGGVDPKPVDTLHP